MKKTFAVIFVLVLSTVLSTAAFAQNNNVAFFMLDSDLNMEGYQGGRGVDGVGAGERVGFAVYVKNFDEMRTYIVDFTWNAEMASFNSDSGANIELDERTVNGVDCTLSESNVLGSVSSLGEVDEPGHYTITSARLGGDAAASTDFELIYCFILKTEEDFSESDMFEVKANVKVLDDTGAERSLGERKFYVNSGVDVQTSTWGEIKSQFKD